MHKHRRQCGGRGCNRRMGQFLDPALLLLLEQAPSHGYTLLNRMGEFGLDFLAPTVVYRTLREMEVQGWVTSTWDKDKTQGPPRRVYTLTAAGRGVLSCCIAQLQNSQQVLTYFMSLYDDLTRKNKINTTQHEDENQEVPMRIVIPATGVDLDATTASVFGRCSTFIIVDPDTLEFEALPNPAQSASGGAGVQAAQTVLQYNIQAVIAPRLGPNAFRVIQAAHIPAYVLKGTSVRETIAAFKAEQLTLIETPGAGHNGMKNTEEKI